MAGRFSTPHRLENRDSALTSKIPGWLALIFLLTMCLLIALGIYIGLHSRVLGPDY
jgi:uncharacterized membrane protein